MESRDEWVKFINTNPTPKQYLWEYCKYRGKDNEELFSVFYAALVMGEFRKYGTSVKTLLEYAHNYICEHFSIIELKNKEGLIIKFY